MKNRTKLVNVDIVKAMQAILDRHTQYYKTDFVYDVATLKEAASNPRPADRTFIWMCRTHGTWLLRAKDMFIRDSHAYSVFTFYAECTNDTIRAFVVEVAGLDGDTVTGNLYAIDYKEYYEHVRKAAVPAGSIIIDYERGQKSIPPTQHFGTYPDKELGQFRSFEFMPESPEQLEMLIRDEKQNRGRFKAL